MPITIALDGYSSCGKSTLSQALAREMGYVYVDSGAMYRAVTLYFIRQEVDLKNETEVASALKTMSLDFIIENHQQSVRLNGEIVDDALRSMRVNALVSPVATLSSVRSTLVAKQQVLGKLGGIVMDGRDIGTVVFPQAELKLFVTASTAVRVERRFLELAKQGKNVSHEAVRQNLLERDRIDSTRADSPLRQADDAVLLDNSALSREEQLAMVLALARLRAKMLVKT